MKTKPRELLEKEAKLLEYYNDVVHYLRAFNIDENLESDRRRNSGHLCRSIIIPRYFEGRDQDEVLVDKDRKESRKQICDKMQKCCNKGMLF